MSVERVAETTQDASQNVLSGSGELAEVSATLRREVDHFLAAMRSSQSDRRRYERVPVQGKSVAVDIEGTTYQAGVVDISQGGIGLMLAAHENIRAGKAIAVRCDAITAALNGRIARLEGDRLGAIFSADPENMMQIRRLLDVWTSGGRKLAA